MMSEGYISMKELVEVRKQEMASMRPNLITKVGVGDKEVVIESPNTLERGKFKVKE